MKNTVAIDLGSSKTAIYQAGEDIVLFEPTVIALERGEKNRVKEIGIDAKKLIGRASDSTEVISPVFEGEVNNSLALTKLLEQFLNRITLKKLSARPRVILNVPCGADLTTIRKFEKVLTSCDVNDYSFVESLVMTSLGLDLQMSMSPNFIVDIGGGITEIGAVSADGVICGVSVNMGGLSVDTMLQTYIEEAFGLKIGKLTAEKVKLTIGSLLYMDNLSMIVNGGDVVSGKPRAVSISSQDILQPIKVFYDKVFEIMQMVMAKLPAEVLADIRRAGVNFSGGGSKIVGLEDYFRSQTGMRANIFNNAEVAVCLGGGKLANDKKMLEKFEIKR